MTEKGEVTLKKIAVQQSADQNNNNATRSRTATWQHMHSISMLWSNEPI